jgi:hypothetical protein
MVLVLGNYIGLLVAIGLPVLVLRVLSLSNNVTSTALVLSAVLTAMVMFLVKKISAPANSAIERHLKIQKNLLLLFVVGGLSGTLVIFALYGQLKSALDVVTLILWLVSVAIILLGIFRSCRELIGRRP